jgi:hypothetical protein
MYADHCKICSNICFWRKILLNSLFKYPQQVKRTHVFEHSYGLFQAGEDFDRAGEKYRKLKGDLHRQGDAQFQVWGASELLLGSDWRKPADFLSEFIRTYRIEPRAD